MLEEYQKQKISLKYWLLGKEYYQAVLAMEFASKYHTGLRMDGVTPEFHHQVSIAHYLRTLPALRHKEAVLSAAFLHDTVEDYDVSLTDIESRFGVEVREAVELLSKIVQEYKKGPDDYFQRMAMCPIASIVKGGDRVHNSQTMHDAFSLDKQQSYIDETINYIMPMLKKARKNFPDQEMAYENIKHVLRSQIKLVELSIAAEKKLEISNG